MQIVLPNFPTTDRESTVSVTSYIEAKRCRAAGEGRHAITETGWVTLMHWALRKGGRAVLENAHRCLVASINAGNAIIEQFRRRKLNLDTHGAIHENTMIVFLGVIKLRLIEKKL